MARGFSSLMQIAGILLYVSTLSLMAVLFSAAVYRYHPELPTGYFEAAACFAGLGALSWLLGYKKAGRNESGSIAFLPLLASIIVAPHWISIVNFAVALSIVEVVNRRAPIKALFNVVLTTLQISLGIVAYLGLGGKSLLESPSLNLLALVTVLLISLLTNSAGVNGAIAVSENKRFLDLWRRGGRQTLLYDVFALPFVYGFAWIYVQFGWVGAAALVIPLLGARELYKTNWKLQQANQELLQLMVAAIEARDPYTSGHSLRVSRSARSIASAIGLSDRAVDRISVAALLHDVGKIHEVFGPILSKPGRLTPEENQIMQTHPIKSAELVATVSQFKDIVPAIRHHHENWDGTGYPDRIAGELIPLGSRIIMFADTIDAMTTDRPYRKALGEGAVRAELIKYRGIQFDPSICDVVLSGNTLAALLRKPAQEPELIADPVPAALAVSP